MQPEQLMHSAYCQTCGGSGEYSKQPDTYPGDCPTCNGTGKLQLGPKMKPAIEWADEAGAFHLAHLFDACQRDAFRAGCEITPEKDSEQHKDCLMAVLELLRGGLIARAKELIINHLEKK